VKGYPRLSETFIAQEILALEQCGLGILIVSLRHPTDRTEHPINAAISAERLYLPEYLHREPVRVWRGWRRARRQQGYRGAWRRWLANLLRDPTPNRVRRLRPNYLTMSSIFMSIFCIPRLRSLATQR
jgi:hypothetical protein